MDNILYEKPIGAIKKWSIAGIITSILFLVSYVFVDLYYYQMMDLMYGAVPGAMDYVSIFLSVNGLFGTAAVVFFVGMFAAKRRRFFINFMLWALLLLDLYFVMPSISSLVQMFTGYTGLDLMYYLGLILPQTLAAVLLVSFILQKDSEKKRITRVLSWVSILGGAVLFVFQIIYVLMNAATDVLSMGYSLSGAAIIAFIVCLSGLLLSASKTASGKTGNEPSKVPEEADDGELDEVVEKIAQQVCKGDEPSSKVQEPDEA